MYRKPELLIETFDVEDIITASSGGSVTPPPEEPTTEAYTTPQIPI
ncbi:MAG: hypothetical protein ACI4I5_08675 [Acutalibacteraceae bacterium]